ncbi:HNH endonuclease family protein, partial [Ornithobacterium rhinotracheale]
YKALVNKLEPKPGVIKNAYDFFKKLIGDRKRESPQIKLEHYIRAIQKMNVAVIFLDERPYKGEDPQIIFETLNSLGKPLTLSDLVRNFVLLNMESNKQSEIYEGIWHPKIEAILNENTSKFFRDYLQYKTASSLKIVNDSNTKELYQYFKSFVEKEFNDHENFIDDIVHFVVFYKWIITEVVTDIISPNKLNDKKIKELLRNIFHDIKSEAFKPFVLGLLDLHQSEKNDIKLTDDILISTLTAIRTYLIRRRVLGLTQGENKNIIPLVKKIELIKNGDLTMFELLTNMFYRLRLPNDNEMKDSLTSLNFYKGLKQYSKLILGKIEEHNTKVAVDFRDSKITIEHIMPQTLGDSWKVELGEKSNEIHQKYIHNIGNLILTEFNSEIGNKSFEEKKDKIRTSSLSYRLGIIDKNIWNEESIIEHQKNMIKWFLSTFEIPDEYKEKANWNTKTVEDVSFSPLDIDANEMAEGNKPKELHVFKEVIEVNTWQDIFVSFLKYLRESQNFDFNFILDNQ